MQTIKHALSKPNATLLQDALGTVILFAGLFASLHLI